MECHKREHRATARCASALLAAGALLATAAGQLGGSASRPALGPAAVGLPENPEPAPVPDLSPAPGLSPASGPAAEKAPPKKAVARTTPAKKPPAKRPPAKQPSAKMTRPAHTGHLHSKPSHTRPSKTTPAHAKAIHAKPAHTKPTHNSPSSHLPAALNAKAAKAVREALSLIGVPYVWGGTTRAGFDCSGFAQHVWAVAGVKIPRTVRQQAAAGTPVPLSQVQPGDLVVFYPSRHHVGVYIGDGLVVDSPHPGSHVRTDPIRSMPVSIVVRPHM